MMFLIAYFPLFAIALVPNADAQKKNAGFVHTWSVAWRHDGKFLASASYDRLVRIWRPDGKLHAVCKGHRREVTFVAWRPDGKQLASASFDGTVRVWNFDGSPGPVLEGHQGVVAAVAWSPDGQRLISGGFADGVVRMWTADGKAGPVLKGHRKRVNSVAWSPDGKRFASGSYDGTIRLWRGDGTLEQVLDGGGGIVYSVAWHPGGFLLVAGSDDGTIHIWDREFAKRGPFRFAAHNGYVAAVAWRRDGKRFASAGADQCVRTWGSDGTPQRILKGHGHPPQNGNRYNDVVHSVSWSPDGKRIASGGMDGSIRLWESQTGKMLWVRGLPVASQ